MINNNNKNKGLVTLVATAFAFGGCGANELIKSDLEIRQESQEDILGEMGKTYQDDDKKVAEGYYAKVVLAVGAAKDLDGLTQALRDGDQNFAEILNLSRTDKEHKLLAEDKVAEAEKAVAAAFDRVVKKAYDNNPATPAPDGQVNGAVESAIMGYAHLMGTVASDAVSVLEGKEAGKKVLLVTDKNKDGDNKTYVFTFNDEGTQVTNIREEKDYNASAAKTDDMKTFKDSVKTQTKLLRERVVNAYERNLSEADTEKAVSAYMATAEGRSWYSNIDFTATRGQNKAKTTAGAQEEFSAHPQFHIASAFNKEVESNRLLSARAVAEMIAESPGYRNTIGNGSMSTYNNRRTSLENVKGLMNAGLVYNAETGRPIRKMSELGQRLNDTVLGSMDNLKTAGGAYKGKVK